MTKSMLDQGSNVAEGTPSRGEYTGVEARAKPVGTECPRWMSRGDTLAVSWGLQRWAETGSRESHTLTLTLAIHLQLPLVFLVLKGKESLTVDD